MPALGWICRHRSARRRRRAADATSKVADDGIITVEIDPDELPRAVWLFADELAVGRLVVAVIGSDTLGQQLFHRSTVVLFDQPREIVPKPVKIIVLRTAQHAHNFAPSVLLQQLGPPGSHD